VNNILGNLFSGMGSNNILGNLMGGGNNPLSMIMGMMGNGGLNPQGLMKQFGNDPNFQQAQQMLGGKNLQEQQQIVMNLAKERGIDVNQLQNMAKQFGIKL